MKITIFGTGYVGLVEAAVLAEFGHEVLCIDVDAAKIAALAEGKVGIYEPDLDVLVQRNVEAGRLAFSTDAELGVAHARVLLVAVGTPSLPDGSADLQYVTAATRAIAEAMDEPRVVVIKSTVPIGTADRVEREMAEILARRGSWAGAEIVSSPEFLKEGSAVADCMRPDRIIIGTASAEAERVLRHLYAPLNRNHDRVMVMDRRSAELTKYAANCMLATKISFMNEMADIAERLGADIEAVRRGIGADPRIGYGFIYAGIGFGGSCFPKDVRALERIAGDAGAAVGILSAVANRNAVQKQAIADKVQRHFGGATKGKRFALWGLAFKPGTNDMREAPSRTIMEALWAMGASVAAHDPAAMEECRALYGTRADLALAPTPEAALEGADALIVATEWKLYQAVDFEALRQRLKSPVVFDGRNIYDPATMRAEGFTYYGIGRGDPLP